MDFDPMAGYEAKSYHCMVDLETVDNVPTAGIASIGAVLFDDKGLYDEFYCVVDHTTCLRIGMTSSSDTLDWWSRQSADARKIFDESTLKLTIREALQSFSMWYKSRGGLYIWGNGADFDNAILSVAYRLTGSAPPWKYSNSRCFRTAKHKGYISNRGGTYHNALDDAKNQAQYMIDNRIVPTL